MRKENTKRIAELATVALLSTVGSSTISQTLPLILMIQSAIVSADATVPAQTDRLAANLPAAVVAAFVNSPVNAAKMMAPRLWRKQWDYQVRTPFKK